MGSIKLTIYYTINYIYMYNLAFKYNQHINICYLNNF